MDAAISGASRRARKGFAWPPDEKSAADGEVVWSWRRDRGVYPARLVAGLATVTTNAAHRGEHEAVVKTNRAGKAGVVRLNLW